MNEKGNNILEYYDLQELNYLTACIKETLRKYPTLPYLDRLCNETCKLSDVLTVEKGTPVFINVHAMHYNEKYYPEPNEWRPERFLGSSDNDNRDFTYLAFGEGPRYCIGKRYGLLQVRSAIVHMMMKFRFKPEENYLATCNPYCPMLSIKDGGKIKFMARYLTIV